MSAPRVIIAVPPPLVTEFFDEQSLLALERVAERLGGALVFADTVDAVDDTSAAEVLVTAWGAPVLDAGRLARLPALRLVAHTGASVRFFVTDALFDAGVRVTQAGEAMSRPVAEVALTFTLALLHRVHRFDHALHTDADWDTASAQGRQHELAGSPVTVVGASRTGRAYIAMARALGADVRLVDPTVDAAEATALGVRLMHLDEAIRTSRILALHAPSLPETRHLIGAEQLALLPDGAGVVNTARSWLVDEDALIAELRTGRLDAAIDVFDDEPLPTDHPFRGLSNVLLTPHRAAGTVEGRLRQGAIVAHELVAYVDSGALAHEITRERLETMA